IKRIPKKFWLPQIFALNLSASSAISDNSRTRGIIMNKPDDLIPRTILFGNPEKANPQISPDGTMMAYLAPVNNVLNVWVGTIGSEDYRPVTNDIDRGIRFYFWAADNQHILYLQDTAGNENWRLYATNLATRETRELTPFENVQVQIVDHN